jgi:hypothetical protein
MFSPKRLITPFANNDYGFLHEPTANVRYRSFCSRRVFRP